MLTILPVFQAFVRPDNHNVPSERLLDCPGVLKRRTDQTRKILLIPKMQTSFFGLNIETEGICGFSKLKTFFLYCLVFK